MFAGKNEYKYMTITEVLSVLTFEILPQSYRFHIIIFHDYATFYEMNGTKYRSDIQIEFGPHSSIISRPITLINNPLWANGKHPRMGIIRLEIAA